MKYLQKERKLIVEYCNKLIDSGLTVGTGGNISIFDRETGYMAISPSGVKYHKMIPEDVVVMDLNKNIIEGELKPSSEFEMHIIVYKNRDDVNAMIHTHALYATTISCLNESLPAVHYLLGFAGGKDIRCAKYATYGTKEIAENALEAMKGRNAVLLANHGINVVGKNIEKTFGITEQLEFCCRLYWQTKSMGNPQILPEKEMDKMVEKFNSYAP